MSEAIELMKAKLAADLDALPHTHSKRVERPWWRWTIHWDPERHNLWIRKHDTLEVPCSTRLEPKSRVKVERERTGMQTKVIASRQYHCPEPSVQGQHFILMYVVAATFDE